MPDAVQFSVVIPVFRNRESIPELVERLAGLFESLHGTCEAVFVIDGSPDDSVEVLRRSLSVVPLPAQVIELSRNFGSFAAIRVGLEAATGEYCGVMAADLQEPVELMEDFFTEMAAGKADIVIGQRASRRDSPLSSLSSRIFWGFYRRWINRDIPPGGVDVFGCTREVSQRLAGLAETHTSLIGLLFWIGYRRSLIEYDRLPRATGKSGWTLRKRLRYLFDSVYAFTDLPVVALQVIGLVGFAASLAIGAIVFIAWLAGGISSPGYTPVMLVLTGSTSLILIALGVVGSYVWRGYENSKGRPVAITMRAESFNLD